MLGTGGFVTDEVKQHAAEKFQQATQDVVMKAAMRNISGPTAKKTQRKSNPSIKGRSGDLKRRDDSDDEEEQDSEEDDFDFDEDELNRLRNQRLEQVSCLSLTKHRR
jgi:phosphopantothenoylcysteine synthetase/decarboxylase